MSERKVLQKYYPPTFDPSQLTRRKKGPKPTGPKVQTVRIMAPFSMRCTTCGEFIYKGRKFNSRKETPLSEKYLNIQIFFFHIKCTRCSGEITFRTDPKNNDYAMVKGAIRNMEPWRNRQAEEETVEQRLERLEREAKEEGEEENKNAMAELEAKNDDTRLEMAAADALDEIRKRNARIHRSEKEGTDYADAIVREGDEERLRQEREDEEAAKRAFAAARSQADLEIDGEEDGETAKRTETAGPSWVAPEDEADEVLMPPPPVPPAEKTVKPAPTSQSDGAPSFKRVVKKKKDHSALLGIKKKPSLV